MNRKNRRKLRQAAIARATSFASPVTDSEPPQSDLDYWEGVDGRKYEHDRKQWADAMNRLDALSKRLSEEAHLEWQEHGRALDTAAGQEGVPPH